MKYSELIQAYLAGELSTEERRDFEAAMERDELLRKEVDLHREVDSALLETDILSLRGKLKDAHQRITSPAQDGKIFHLRPKQAVYAVAAVAILLVASAWVFTLLRNPSISSDQLYEMYYQPDDAVMVMRSGDDQGQGDLLVEALRMYEDENFEGALQLFKKDDSNLMVHFYSGLAYMEIEHFNEAIRSFQTILDDQQNLFVEQAQWYQGLCYLKTGRPDMAKEVLNELAVNGGPYKVKVEFILKNLKE